MGKTTRVSNEWWALSPLDDTAHVIRAGDQPPRALKARCGHLLPAIATEHPTADGRTCRMCAEILCADHLRSAVHALIAVLGRAHATDRDTLGQARWTLDEVVALAEQAPDLDGAQLRDRLQGLADRTPQDG